MGSPISKHSLWPALLPSPPWMGVFSRQGRQVLPLSQCRSAGVQELAPQSMSCVSARAHTSPGVLVHGRLAQTFAAPCGLPCLCLDANARDFDSPRPYLNSVAFSPKSFFPVFSPRAKPKCSSPSQPPSTSACSRTGVLIPPLISETVSVVDKARYPIMLSLALG